MTDPTDTEKLLAEADNIHGCTKLAAQIIARQLCAKFRELEGERDGYHRKAIDIAGQRDRYQGERDAALAQVARIESLTAYTWRSAEQLRIAIRKCLSANQPAKGEE